MKALGITKTQMNMADHTFLLQLRAKQTDPLVNKDYQNEVNLREQSLS